MYQIHIEMDYSHTGKCFLMLYKLSNFNKIQSLNDAKEWAVARHTKSEVGAVSLVLASIRSLHDATIFLALSP